MELSRRLWLDNDEVTPTADKFKVLQLDQAESELLPGAIKQTVGRAIAQNAMEVAGSIYRIGQHL